MAKRKPIKLHQAHLDAAAEAEMFGALAISSNPKNRLARMTKYGKTTAQLRVIRQSAQRLFAVLRQVGPERMLRIGKATLQLRQHGREEILVTRGL